MKKVRYLMFLKRENVISIVLICIAVLLSGCQPTPEKEIVVGKNQEQIDKMISEAENNDTAIETEVFEPVPIDYKVPEKLECVITSSFEGCAEMEIRVNAQIIIPEYTLPMYRVAHTDIPYENMQVVYGLLVGDQTAYKTKYAARAVLKADIQQRIDHYNFELKYCTDKQGKEHYKKEIAKLLVEYENAPATYEEANIQPDNIENCTKRVSPVTGEITYIAPSGMEIITAEDIGPFVLDKDACNEMQQIIMGAEEGNISNIEFRCLRPETLAVVFRSYPYIQYIKREVAGNYELPTIRTTCLSMDEINVDMTLDEAIDIAMPYAKALDENLELVNSAAAEVYYFTEDDKDIDHTGYGYTLYFSKKYNEVALNYAHGFSYYSEMLRRQQKENDPIGACEFSEPYPQEVLKIVVGPNGVQTVEYEAPTKIVECISNDVELLPFEEIEAKFREYIRYNGWENGKIYMDIDRIQLSLMSIPQPDSDEYLIVPVWDFFGGAVLSSDTTYIPDEEYWNGQIFYHYGRSFLTINAANGSIINRIEGY